MDNTAIITTILGGMLAIIGGFFATYFAQFMTKRSEQEKIRREKLEEIYKLVNEVKNDLNSYHLGFGDLLYEDANKSLLTAIERTTSINSKIDLIEMIAHLYLRPILHEAKNYCIASKKCVEETAHICVESISMKHKKNFKGGEMAEISKELSSIRERISEPHSKIIISIIKYMQKEKLA